MATGHESNKQQSGPAQGAAGAQSSPEWDDLKGDVGEMADAAMEQGRHFLDSAREQATGYVDQRKGALAQSVVDLASTLRETGGGFEGQPSIRAIVEGASGGLEQLADNIRGRSVADILGNVEDLVRRRPGAAAVATLAAGFLLARFVKASTEGARNAGQRGGQMGGAGRQQARGPATPNPSSRGQAQA